MFLADSDQLPPSGPGAVNLAKALLRNTALRRRDDVDAGTRADFATRLASIGLEIVRAYPGPSGPVVASLYVPIGSEPDPMPLAMALQADAVPLSLPVDYSSGTRLIYRAWSPGDRLTAGPLGIAEPLDSATDVEPDILFIPMLAFDRSGRRLGYGAGNVDATLQTLRARKSVLVIGIAFAAQEEPEVPSTPRDAPVDLILTDRERIDCRP